MTGTSAFLLACSAVLQVSAVLLPPRNLKISSENFKHVLTWEDPNNESSIHYRVVYHENAHRTLKTTKYCSNITARRCDLTKDFTDIITHYDVKVSSFTDHESSALSATETLRSPIQETILGPPIVDVIAGDCYINVSILPPVSYLWSEEEQQYVSMLRDDVFPMMDCSIMLQHMSEVTSHDRPLLTDNSTFYFPNLLPNANYCVSVTISTSLSNHPSIPSEPKCVVTKHHVSGSSTVIVVVSVVCGVLLLIILVLALVGLDFAGFICTRKAKIPKFLKSIPSSESTYMNGGEFTSPTFSVPVDIVSETFEVEQQPKSVNKNCEGGYASRKRLPESDSSGATTSGELPSAVSSSVGSSGQANSSAEEDLSAGHRASSAVSEPGSSSVARLPVGATDDSSNLSFNTSGVFNINLNTVSVADRADVWTGFEQVAVPPVEAEDSVESHEAGIRLDQHNDDICLSVDDLDVEYCSEDEEEEDVSESGDSGSNLISGYMRR